MTCLGTFRTPERHPGRDSGCGSSHRSTPWRSSARMEDQRGWLPRWQRVELVELCVERGFSRRRAAAWRRVSVSTVQYWIERYPSTPVSEWAAPTGFDWEDPRWRR